jgi:RNA methyltransferase, TrmH family
VRRISSRQNALVATFRDAARGNIADRVLLDGVHLVTEGFAAGLRVRDVVVSTDALSRPEILSLAEEAGRAGAAVMAATAPVMSAVSPVRSASPIVAIADRPNHAGRMFGGKNPFVLIACDIQDPGNVGAIARVAEAAGAAGLIVAGVSADPFGWKALRGSMGSALRLPLEVVPSIAAAIARARQAGCRIIATVPRGGDTLATASLDGPVAVLIGGEGQGLTNEAVAAADDCLTIPMETPVESLNAAVTAALIAYEARRQRH